ncbi:MAG: hypothetical protein M1540_02485 [Candidatus Bathyarchaeota archaeon]|nr:hypothetical protein [Candidatus Bathyarchaeota archaeon]
MEEICGDTCFHMHMVAVSTCFYVGRVVEFGYATPKQAEKNRLNPKSNAIYKQTCGVP